MTLSPEEKRKFLESLKKDEEFRYAVAGMLGYSEILERITSIEERIVNLEERFARLEERFARLEERFLELEERVARLEEEMISFRRLIVVIAHRFGVISEESFREGMKYVVEEVLGAAKVSKLLLRDERGFVYGHPSTVDVDVLVRDGEHVIVEVKSRVSKGDVAEISRIGSLYEEKEGVKPRLLIVGGFVDKGAAELAKELGVEIRGVIEDL
ncbi:PD-(D/E)XK nuclease family protein [Candidatus Korarchaeum cryptofilum]|jgi:hypothetical protein|uniref:DUF3782 domain-containing protein n=1 Tax=Korarchaeum cryptofilum (strain OPF8) TaxID=374847 RepID=B1L3K1_KORCO|nr:DUF3782 domain-containing protein [Candidatus Korarchaeum cryptofilum]ACB07030.1 Protein of unknown function DUF1626 [Candidatus Korarchaeum cryptofilum OPF8]